MQASSLLEKERKELNTNRAKNVRILRMEMSNNYRRHNEIKWQEAGCASDYDSTQTYYYMALSGYSPVDAKTDPHSLFNRLRGCGIQSLHSLEIHGVRKGDIDWVRSQKNWVPVEEHIVRQLNSVTPTALASLAISELDSSKIFGYNKDIVALVPPTSPYRRYVDRFQGVERSRNFGSNHLVRLCEVYAPTVNYLSAKEQLKAEMVAVRKRYPLLDSITDYSFDTAAVAEYINLIDSTKGI